MLDVSARIANLSAEKRALLATRLKEREEPSPFAIVPRPKGQPLPLSFAQERLWFMVQMDPASPSYSEIAAFHMQGVLDIDALRRSLNEIMRRHESLRTTFIAREGRPTQIIASPCDLLFPTIDLGHVAPASRREEIERLARREITRPFNLAEGPLIRLSLLRLAAEEHVLLIAAHHIVADAWSIEVLVRELGAIYPAFGRGKPSPLPELSIQYADFALRQRERLRREALRDHLSYWKGQLEDAPHLLQLPLDRARSVTQSLPGQMVSLHLSREEANALLRLGRSSNATLFMVLAAAFAVLLGRYSGQYDMCIGYPSANRRGRGLERLIGFFANTLVLRADLSGDPGFAALLEQVRRRVVDAQAHEDLPFEQLVEHLNPPRIPGCTPVFQVWCVVQHAAADDIQLPGLTVSRYALSSSTAKFDLSLIATETRTGLDIAFEYNADLFDACTMERMAGHFQRLLEGIVSEPNARLSELPLLTRAERHRLLIEWNVTAADYPQDKCLHRLFEEQVERAPEAVAVVYEDRQLTYAELNAKANRLAHHLRNSGVGPEVPVGICLERSLEMVVGILGILKAGGGYVPIDPSYPKERIAQLLEDARPEVVLTQEAPRGLLPVQAKRIYLDTQWQAIAGESAEDPINLASPQNLAYVIYTSGSTGRPKGVAVTHRNAVHSTSARLRYYRAPASGFLLLSSMAFDSSVAGLFGTLCQGGRLVLPPAVRDPRRLSHLILSREISHLLAVPSLYEAMLKQITPEEGRSLRTIIVAGEPCRKGLVDLQRMRLPQAELFNEYGPTEATVWSTVYRCEAGCGERMPIGRPIANTRLYVLDERLEPVPIGVAGELYIGGAGVARGYRNHGALTAERFVPDRFGTEPGGRLYKTGDRVRYLADGDLEFLGRVDHQVKIRGFRIEPGDVEATLSQHPAVKEAVILAREDSPGDKRLVAYVVGDEPPPAVEELRRHLKERVPEYMLPSAFVLLEALPLTPNGKVDRNGLPAPDASSQLGHQHVAPRTQTEEILAGIWIEVLGVERVGVHDNFFELGGHSLLATQVVARVIDVLDVELPLTSLFESPTISELAVVVDEIKATAVLRGVSPLVRVSREGDVPLSFAQQRLWFLAQLDGSAPTYHVAGAVRFHGTLELEVVERCVNEIVRRHEVLRTTFASTEGRAIQVVAPALRVSVPILDLSHLPRERLEAGMCRSLEEEAQRPFDLGHGPLLRLNLFKLTAEDHVLCVVMHHIVSDGWSIGVLIREFVALYEAFSAGGPSPLPELPIQYADYAVWQREWLQGEVLERQLAYWKGQLQGAPAVLELPTDRPRPAVQSHQGATHRFTVSRAITEELKALSRREDVTLFMVLLAVFQVLLSRYSGQRDICVGTPIANRNRVEIEGLIGFFVNTLVLRTDLSGNPPFTELLRRVREVCLGAQAHQDLPFEKLVEELAPVRDMSHSPLFQVMFALQNAPEAVLEIQGLKIAPVDVDIRSATFDLTLDITERPDGLDASLICSTDLFDEATIARLAGHYGVLLESIVAKPDSPLSDLEFLTEPERRQLLVEWNATEAEYPKDKCIHQLFEAQVERTPEAVAVVYEDQALTYAELNAKANQLAHFLRNLGVGPDVLVGICVERSLETVIGILGILKAGGAYVPIDPSYPKERIAFMVEDARPEVILTQASLRELLPDHAEAFCLDSKWEEIAQSSTNNPIASALPDNRAYVIYTSGSTGRAKGVDIPHGALCNVMCWMQSSFRLRPEDRVVQRTSLCFDASVWELFAPLMIGAVLIAPCSARGDIDALMQAVKDHRVTVLKIVPSLLEALVMSEELPRCNSLRRIFCGGEILIATLGKQVLDCGDIALVNCYGPTETTIDVTTCDVRKTTISSSVPIGRPIGNTQIYLLDWQLNPVPVGVPGELFIGGAGLARGYLNHPELTAERFIPNPFGEREGERLYRTGDLARYRSDANIEYLGRIDHQVKIRGYRIELGEVEVGLVRHPEVREAVVLAREDSPGEKRLVGYVVSDASVPTVEELRGHLKKRLPESMVPAAFVFLDALPLTPNGKVDRKALPAAERGHQLSPNMSLPVLLRKRFWPISGRRC
ncbi:MAG: amino acid adenylation domain-containing protein [Gammaproteobacteria bacterium]